MRSQDYFYLFVAILVTLGLGALALAAYDNWENTKTRVEVFEAEYAQKEIAREMCLIAGYPSFQTVNGHYYCTGKTQDGEIRIKQIVLE